MYQMLTDKKKNNKKSFPRAKAPIQLLHLEKNCIFAGSRSKTNTLPLILGSSMQINGWVVPISESRTKCVSVSKVFDIKGHIIAMHLCFDIQNCCFAFSTKTMTITINSPHYTARPLEQQELATAVDSSHNVAPNSIHWDTTVSKICKLTGDPNTPADIQQSIRETLQNHTHLAEDKEAIASTIQTVISQNVDNCGTVNVIFKNGR